MTSLAKSRREDGSCSPVPWIEKWWSGAAAHRSMRHAVDATHPRWTGAQLAPRGWKEDLMAQNGIERRAEASGFDHFWRVDLNRPGPWRMLLLVIMGFAIGAICG